MPSATDTAAPEDDPPGTWPISRRHVLFGVPKCGLIPIPENANSVMLVRPITMKPARRNLATTGASASAGAKSSNAREPARVTCPLMSNKSLIETGIPA